MRQLLVYLLNGSPDLYLSKHWRDVHMSKWEAWTVQQLDTAVITKDVAATRREAFWAAREKPKLRIVRAGER